jgi:peptidoglycan/LPS O-acetylase OafA/YrhL
MLQSHDSPNLDLLRSVAVLAVLADHIAGTFGIAQRHPFFWALGRWGVLLFFVHTSLVLMMSMGRLGLNGRKLHVTFFIRRFFRIYPLSIVVVGVVLIAHIPPTSWSEGFVHPDLGIIFSNFLLCQNLILKDSLIGPLWSLPYEVQMYLLLPALFIFVRKTTTGPLVGLWLSSVGLGLAQSWLAATNHGRRLHLDILGIAQFVPCFLVGVIAYHLLRQRQKRWLPFWIWVSTLCIAGVAYLRWNASAGYVGYPEWVCCLPIGLVVVYCAESRHRWFNFLTHHLARYSYGLYLGQVPVLWLVFVRLKYLPLSVQWPLFLFLIAAVPVASYHLIEHPFVKFGASITARELTVRKVGKSTSGSSKGARLPLPPSDGERRGLAEGM